MSAKLRLGISACVALGCLAAVPSTSLAQGTYSFCATWLYSWTDEPGNQDNLTTPLFGVGWQAAHGAFTTVSRDGQVVAWGTLPSDGCVEVAADPGTYTITVTPLFSDGNKTFSVYADNSEQYEVFSAVQTLPGRASGTEVMPIWLASASGVTNMGAVISHLLGRPDMGVVNEQHYVTYVDENCGPRPSTAACYAPGEEILYLGAHEGENRRVFIKHILAHELGHMVSSRMSGGPSNTAYDAEGCAEPDPGQPYTCGWEPECHCGHVTSSNRAHCLQSAEYMRDAATEGWAHFYAAALYNAPGQLGSFSYYKEFLVKWGWIYLSLPPPQNYEIDTAIHPWMETYCSAFSINSRGTEVDWQWFLYNIHRFQGADSYSMSDIALVWANSPGGGGSTWSQLAASAAATFGGSKGALWGVLGDRYGVDH